ncbi:MAG: sugar phosphate isomerase/epimerase [Treponema sp.]|nr:sugar phosphate isomerase/epimerase [Treponema sp.]
MKIGVSTYCYNRLIKAGTFTLFDAIKSARKTGFDFVEFADFTLPEGKSLDAYAGELGKACKEAGIGVCNYATHADFLYGSDGDMKKEVSRLKARVDAAKIMGSPIMRHDSCWGLKDNTKARSWREAIKIMAPAIREVTEYAASIGIRTMTENHGYFLQDSARMEELVLTVNHPNYGLLVDIGNFMCADEISVNALANVMPYAFHVHAKDFLYKNGAEPRPDDSWFPTRAGNHLRGTILGHGVVSVGQCIEYIKKCGYTGVLSLEFEGSEEPLDAVQRGFDYLKKFSRE